MAKFVNKSKRIGILGGTFNPIHTGHLNLAAESMKRLALSKIIFIPAYIPPHKKIKDDILPAQRVKMLRLALGHRKAFSLSLYEVKRKRRSYSIDTVLHLKKKYGRDVKLYFIIGADMLKGIRSWKNADRLFDLVTFVVCSRPHYALTSCPAAIKTLRIAAKDVSSSRVRDLANKRMSLRGLVLPRVAGYIKKHRLYSKRAKRQIV